MAVNIGNVFAIALLVCLGLSLSMAFKFWKINGRKIFLQAFFKGFFQAIGVLVLSCFLSAAFMTLCLSFSVPMRIYLILFFCLTIFLAFSKSKKNCYLAAIIYIVVFFLLAVPGKALGQYFYSLYSLPLRHVDAYETSDQSTVYPAAWLIDLPIKEVVRGYWGWRAFREDGTVVVIKPARLWHSLFTGLYAIDAKSVRVWYPGGTIKEGIERLEFREQKMIPVTEDCLSGCGKKPG
jgi:hypothetical protein